jgi:hypothetical protein
MTLRVRAARSCPEARGRTRVALDSELIEHNCEENNEFEEQIGSGAQR